MLPVDHPGFFDPLYRERRDMIASIADSYNDGDVVPDVPYIHEEHAVWKLINARLHPLYREYACAEYNDCYSESRLSKDKIPQFSVINKVLSAQAFKVVPVSGLVSPREFLSKLSDNTMLCTQYIRHYSKPEYTPEPDVVHEILGHCIFFLNGDLADLNRLFGEVARHASDDEINRLIRLYWHTIEFGVCMEDDKVKAYGAGLLSSIRELSCINSVPLKKFNISIMENTPYDTMNPQPFLFCGDSFSQIIKDLTEHLNNLL